jgi:hypothetical protein
MFKDITSAGQVFIRLTVDGRSKYEAIGVGGLGFAQWKGTLRNLEIKTDKLSMENLPCNVSKAESAIRTFAESTYQGRNIQVKKYINGRAA